MARLVFSSLRGRLLALVLLAFAPALGLILYTASDQRHLAAQEARNNALRLAKLAAADHDLLIEGTRQLLAALAQLPAVRQQDARACTALFAALLTQFPRYANLGVIAPDGLLFCSALPLPGRTNLADRAYFRLAMESRDFAIGEYQVGRVTGRASINFGYPVLADGRVRAVVFAALDLTWLGRLVSDVQLPPGSAVTVIDRQGTILTRHPDPERWVGKSAPEAEFIRAMLSLHEGTAGAHGIDGVPRLYGFAPLRGSRDARGAYVSVGIPKEVVFAEANRGLLRNLAGLGLVVVVIFVATRLFADAFILRPVNALVETTRQLKGGDVHARSGPPYGRGEIGQLARAFDEMAGALETRHREIQQAEQELRRVNRALRVLSAGNRALVSATEESDLLRVICQTIVDVGGYRMAWVGYAEPDEMKRVRPIAWAGAEAGYPESITVTWAETEHGRGPVGSAIRNGTAQVVKQIPTDPAFGPWSAAAAKRGYGSVIALPLRATDRVFGALAIYAEEPDAFDAEEEKLLSELADDLAYGVMALRTQAERMRAEEELQRQREALFQSEKLAALGRLAAGVGHELKNPLAVIQGRLKLLGMDMAAGKLPAGEPLARHVASLTEAEERMRRIMEGLSAYSKPSKPHPIPLPLGELLSATRELLAYQARNADVVITVDTPADLPPVWGDRSQVMQILLNLSTNAIEAMAGRGGRLSLRAGVQGEGGRQRVRVEAADTGPGIPPEMLARIWDPFFTTKGEGTGLGLSIVRGLVAEQPGSTIDVESQPGQGTTFTLTFPIAESPPEPQRSKGAP